MMRILRIYIKLPPSIGGMEQHIKNLSEEQIRQGHYVVVAFNEGNHISESDIQVLPSFKLARLRPQFFGFFLFYFSLLFSLLFKRTKVDILHIHGDWSSLIFSFFIKKIVRAKRVVYSNHGYVKQNRFTFSILKREIRNVDLIHCTGIETAQIFAKHTDTPVLFQPSGIRRSFLNSELGPPFHLFNRDRTILTVANLVAVKNLFFIIELASKLIEFQFLIVGTGELEEDLLSIIGERQLANISLLGSKNDQELSSLYKSSNLFLLTSYTEGFPTVLMEAMFFGLPIVSSNAGKIDRLVRSGVNGYIIDEFNIESYIEKILLLTNDKDLYGEISSNNFRLSRQFTWERCAFNLSHAMTELLNS